MIASLRPAGMIIAAAVLLSIAASPAEADHPLVGAQSCATTGCHGRLETTHGAPSLTEFRVWLSDDPHASAYASLKSEEGERILTNLLGKHVSPADPLAVAAWKNCLGCHNTNTDVPDGQAFRASLVEGVGCESCHGTAGAWKNAHYAAEFRDKSPLEKAELGLRDLKSASIKAQVCVRCHVAGQGVVDHDLIAAGHPAMNFELTAYFAALPPHWKTEATGSALRDQSADWLAGQLATGRAAVDQVLASISAGRGRTVDFAQHDCAACHHRLTGSDRISNAFDPVRILPPWGTWNLGLLELAANDPGAGAPPGTSVALRELRETMQGRHFSPETEVHDRCSSASRLLAEWSQADLPASARPQALRRVARQAAAAPPEDQALDWNRTVQTLYLMRAITPAGETLRTLEDELQFPRYRTRSTDTSYRRTVRTLLKTAAEELPE